MATTADRLSSRVQNRQSLGKRDGVCSSTLAIQTGTYWGVSKALHIAARSGVPKDDVDFVRAVKFLQSMHTRVEDRPLLQAISFTCVRFR